jgi:hypothetical protein
MRRYIKEKESAENFSLSAPDTKESLTNPESRVSL